MHWSTLAMPPLALAYAWFEGVGPAGLSWWLAASACVLACVLLHELGHALAARRLGVRVHDVVLLPIGGAARLERLPGSGAQEAAVALAGPLVNLAIAAALAPALWAWPRHEWFPWMGNYDLGSLLASLSVFNALVFAFNLVPIFPLDGGRVLRAAISRWTTRLRATRLAVVAARVAALLLLGVAVYVGSFLVGAFALYAFLAAGRELRAVTVQTFLEDTTVGELAEPCRDFAPSTPLGDIRDHLRRSGQRGAVVADECSPIGFATAELLAEEPATRPVGDLDLTPVVCYDSEAPVRHVSAQLAAMPGSVAVEEIDHRPAGVLDLDLLEEAFARWRENA